ncbi:unnamed protein product [Vicia faba]|uniref:Uncharacterized protein n=1 Tax=Vicia faba TaxID=3906 RepID=A0AAV0YS31_VICFA|nr:unnamed protein product [Vicia faba]
MDGSLEPSGRQYEDWFGLGATGSYALLFSIQTEISISVFNNHFSCKELILKITSGCNRFSKSFQVHNRLLHHCVSLLIKPISSLLCNGNRVLTPKYKIYFIKLVVREYLIYLVRLGKRGENRNGWVKRGTVHTTGRRAHRDVAIELEKKLSRPPNLDELFMVTHKKKNGRWVGRDAENTHEAYWNVLIIILCCTG